MKIKISVISIFKIGVRSGLPLLRYLILIYS